MSEYLKTAVAAVLSVGLISALFPKDAISKYVGILSGIIVMAILVSPILHIGKKDIELQRLDVKTLELNTSSYIMDAFEKELAENITKKLKSETGIDFSVIVYADKKDETIEIKQIEIAPYSKKYAMVISEYLGIAEGRIVEK